MADDEITLRQWTVSDASWYVECSRDNEIQRFTSDRTDLTPQDVAAAIEASAACADHEAFLICSASDGRRLGNLAVEYCDQTAHVSYWVAARERGRRVASKALDLLLQRIREGARVEAVELWVHADNIGSRRVAEGAGFVRAAAGDCERVVKGAAWPTVTYRFRFDVR